MQIKIGASKTLIKVGFLLLIIGLILSIIAGVLISKYNKKKQTYIQTIGLVIDYDSREEFYTDEDETSIYYMYAPIVEFMVNGKTYKAKYNVYMLNPPALGTEMPLRYNQNDPRDVVFDNDQSRIAVPVIAGIFIIVGFISLILGNIKSKKESEG